MRVLRVAIFSCLLAAPLPGCVFPGSSFGHLSIRGSLELTTGEPLADREVRFVLPATYGLSGLDRLLGKTEDFGHQAHRFSVTKNHNGEFSLDLGDRGRKGLDTLLSRAVAAGLIPDPGPLDWVAARPPQEA